ncbi:MAG: cell wall-binding repeat-containing protein [Solirubrobacteraceae bacterium]
MRSPPLRLAAALLLGATLAGCGKSLPTEGHSHGASVTTVAGTSQLAASGLATKNTTRLGGANSVADAAAVALATYPGLTPTTRPQAVVVVDDRDWTAALAASALASSPLRAPILYSEGSTLPALSAQALAALKPTGSALLHGTPQVIAIGGATAPSGYRTLALSGEPAALAAQVERLTAVIHGGRPHRVIVVGADGPEALAMPAAGLAAESGAPILPVDATVIPPATRRVLARLHHPVIYAVGPPTAVSHAVLVKLRRSGAVRRIYPTPGTNGTTGPGTSGEDPANNAIAVARYADGSFGWGVEQPGHGLVFARASRPLDAPAAAPLSANGDYAPLLLLEAPNQVPSVLREYLGDIQPAYTDAPEYQPVHGAYNHGWLIGDEEAIAPTVQAELDAMLEIAPQSTTSTTTPAAPTGTESTTPAEPTTTTP